MGISVAYVQEGEIFFVSVQLHGYKPSAPWRDRYHAPVKPATL